MSDVPAPSSEAAAALPALAKTYPIDQRGRAERRLACLTLAIEVVRHLPPQPVRLDVVKLAGEFAAFVEAEGEDSVTVSAQPSAGLSRRVEELAQPPVSRTSSDA